MSKPERKENMNFNWPEKDETLSLKRDDDTWDEENLV